MTRTLRRAPLVALLGVALALTACGGGDDDGGGGTIAAPAPKGAADPRAAIQAWFTAKRLGNAADGCALESESYQTAQYGGAGQPCLDDAANKMPQPVWAEQTMIVALQESGDSATATVEPNAGTPAQATVGLVRVDGGWLIDSFR